MWQGNSLAGGILAALHYLEGDGGSGNSGGSDGGGDSGGGGEMVLGAVMTVTAAVSSNLCTHVS